MSFKRLLKKEYQVHQKDISVQTNAGRIALIAYVVGGWLLPLLHDHGSHQHIASAARGLCGSHATSTCDSGSHSHQHAAHQHAAHNEHKTPCKSHDQESPSLEHRVPTDSSGFVAGSAASAHDHGLCALCIARSSSAARVTLEPLTFRPLGVCRSAPQRSRHCFQFWWPIEPSRGPPTAV